jgi:hypothetical protein
MRTEHLEKKQKSAKHRQASGILFAYQFPPRDMKSFSGDD